MSQLYGPKPYPIVGNIPHVGTPSQVLDRIEEFFEIYGPIVRVRMMNETVHFTHDAAIIGELLQREEEFPKLVTNGNNPIRQFRKTLGQALFTADDTEKLWEVGNRILMPAFGIKALKQCYPAIFEATKELLSYLDKKPNDAPIDIPDLMARVTYETISLAGFSTKFGCITDGELDPFLRNMNIILKEATSPMTFLGIRTPWGQRRWSRAEKAMLKVVHDIIEKRQQDLIRGEAVPIDVLQIMLTSADRRTGEKLPQDNIAQQLVTLLVAGHETTGSALAYALYHLSQNPEIEAKLIAEIDERLGRDYTYQPTFEDIMSLDYTERVFKETLRTCPTAPGFFKTATGETTIGDGYPLSKGDGILVHLPALHRNPKYWGPNARQFDPDRFLPENSNDRHPHAFHAFGLGRRSCIGFMFATIEAKLILAMLYQRFRFRLCDPSYQLNHAYSLTMKPADLLMKRESRPEDRSQRPKTATKSAPKTTSQALSKDIRVYFASNMGASEEVARKLARLLKNEHIQPSVLEFEDFATLREFRGFACFVTSTYNGQPPEGGQPLLDWLYSTQDSESTELAAGLRAAVIGCGNTQWQSTYQKFPQQVYDALVQRKVALQGTLHQCNAAADFEADVESALQSVAQTAAKLFPTAYGDEATASVVSEASGAYTVTIRDTATEATPPTQWFAKALKHKIFAAEITENRELQSQDSGRSTRHIALKIDSTEANYTAGDHLLVWAENPVKVVQHISKRCELPDGANVTVRADDPASHGKPFPLDTTLNVSDLLKLGFDFNAPLSRNAVNVLLENAKCPQSQSQLSELRDNSNFRQEVLQAGLRLVDLIQDLPSLNIDLATLITISPENKPRYYSISSAPDRDSQTHSRCDIDITVGVQTFPTSASERSGHVSGYLPTLEPGSKVFVAIEPASKSFGLPEDDRPLIFVGAGTGLAPFRGFLQELQARRDSGTPTGPARLYFGCRREDHDFLYKTELEALKERGILRKLIPAFSRPTSGEKRYVQDKLKEDADEIFDILQSGGTLFVCGDAGGMAQGVQESLLHIGSQKLGGIHLAQNWIESLRSEMRYLEDIW